MKKILFLVCVVALSAVPCGAIVIGDTNFELLGYADHNCYQPMLPYDDDSYAWEAFERQVDDYRSCIERYVKAADNDRLRIQEKSQGAIREFNSFVESVQAAY
jgi:hypothetical protein